VSINVQTRSTNLEKGVLRKRSKTKLIEKGQEKKIFSTARNCIFRISPGREKKIATKGTAGCGQNPGKKDFWTFGGTEKKKEPRGRKEKKQGSLACGPKRGGF